MRGWFPIPAQYDNPRTSNLKFTLVGGENSIDINLK